MFAGSITELATILADVTAVGVAGFSVYVIARAFSWGKGALS